MFPVCKLYLSLRQIKGDFLCTFFKKNYKKVGFKSDMTDTHQIEYPFNFPVPKLYIIFISFIILYDCIRSKSTNPLSILICPICFKNISYFKII